MKNLRLIGAMMMVMAGLIGGCDGDNPLGSEGDPNTLTAKVNGITWTNSAMSASRVVPPGAITIVGVAGSTSEQISLQIRGTGVADYTLSGEQQWASYTRGGTQYSTSMPGGSGTISVTKYDETNRLISGTFTFVAKDASGSTVTVTDGKFVDVKWSEQ